MAAGPLSIFRSDEAQFVGFGSGVHGGNTGQHKRRGTALLLW